MDDFSHNLTEDMYNNFDDIVFPIVIWYSNTYNRVTPLSNSAPAKTHLYKKCRKMRSDNAIILLVNLHIYLTQFFPYNSP